MGYRVWILVIAAVTGSADAAEFWTSCNSCSEPQAQWVAERATDGAMHGRHIAYVADFDRETIRKFSVWREYDPEFRAWETSSWRVATETHIEFEFALLVSAIKADVASLDPGKPVPADVVESAYDLVHNSVNRQRVAGYIFNNLSMWESIGAPVFVPLSLFRKIVDLNLTISVSFADGSTAQFVLTGVDGTLGELEYVFELVDDSARDADGNVIPGSAVAAAPFEGTFSSQATAQRMTNFIQTWYGTATGPVIRCSSKQVGNNIVVTCKRN